MVPHGAIVTYLGKWPSLGALSTFTRASTYVGAVAARLATAGLAVRDSSFSGETTLGFVSPSGLDVKLVLQVQNRVGFGDPEDIIAVIRHHVFEYAGAFPLSDSIPFQQNPDGRQTGTGQPRPSGPTIKACAGALNQNGNWDIGCWLSSLTNQGMWAIGLVAIGLLTLVVLLPAQSVRVIRAARA